MSLIKVDFRKRNRMSFTHFASVRHEVALLHFCQFLIRRHGDTPVILQNLNLNQDWVFGGSSDPQNTIHGNRRKASNSYSTARESEAGVEVVYKRGVFIE